MSGEPRDLDWNEYNAHQWGRAPRASLTHALEAVAEAASDTVPDTVPDGELTPADLIHSSYALPYCPPEHFDRVWSAVRTALKPGGVLACQLFGPHDDTFGEPDVTFHSEEAVRRLVDGLEVVRWVEEDDEGQSFTGPRHWHVFHVVARRLPSTDARGTTAAAVSPRWSTVAAKSLEWSTAAPPRST